MSIKNEINVVTINPLRACEHRLVDVVGDATCVISVEVGRGEDEPYDTNTECENHADFVYGYAYCRECGADVEPDEETLVAVEHAVGEYLNH